MNQDWITSFEALKSVYADEAYSNIAINEAISRHKGCRDSFVRTMVKGTLRETVTIDYIIDHLAEKGISSIKIRPLTIIRMGLYALRSLDSVPDHAAVSEAVNLARTAAKGTDRFINAILRSYIRRRAEFDFSAPQAATDNFWLRFSFPPEIAKMIQSQYGEDAPRILEGLNEPPELVLRVNTLRTSREALAEQLASEGITTHPAKESARALIAEGGRVISSSAYHAGLFTVQSLASIRAIECLAPTPGSRVLDMCAAPGGKTTLLAELMANSGSITACDIHEHRLRLIEASAKRLGSDIISTRLLDGTIHEPELDNSFDCVLADVPCSGFGVMGSKPEIRLRAKPAEYGELAEIQLAILRNAVRYAKPGGLIEYSTCTINKEENERVIEAFLREGISAAAPARSIPASADEHVDSCAKASADEHVDSCAKASADAPALREGISASVVEMHTILPYNKSIGFYYCLLRKHTK